MAVLPPDPVFSLRCPEMGAVNSLCFHESERLLAGTLKGKVFLWDLQVRKTKTITTNWNNNNAYAFADQSLGASL